MPYNMVIGQKEIQPFEFRNDTYVVDVDLGDRTARVSVYYFNPKQKLLSNQKYHWLYKSSIVETSGNFGGKLLHGEYLEYYHNGQLSTKGQFKNGVKKGKWSYWNRDGSIIEKQKKIKKLKNKGKGKRKQNNESIKKKKRVVRKQKTKSET